MFVGIVGGNQMRSVELGEDAFLACEMHGFIRSDSDFLWMKGNETLENSDRITIIIFDGAAMRGQFGGTEPVVSRVSSLMIADTEESDEGIYTCFVAGTVVKERVHLTVNLSETTTTGIFVHVAISVAKYVNTEQNNTVNRQ